uniref:Uncharacterized protein n=1 Tax=Lotharella globosa TaxID=91324 RepID=A0A7S4DKL5_9EUKA
MPHTRVRAKFYIAIRARPARDIFHDDACTGCLCMVRNLETHPHGTCGIGREILAEEDDLVLKIVLNCFVLTGFLRKTSKQAFFSHSLNSCISS